MKLALDAHWGARAHSSRFVEKEITPNTDTWEEERNVPHQVWHKMGL